MFDETTVRKGRPQSTQEVDEVDTEGIRCETGLPAACIFMRVSRWRTNPHDAHVDLPQIAMTNHLKIIARTSEEWRGNALAIHDAPLPFVRDSN